MGSDYLPPGVQWDDDVNERSLEDGARLALIRMLVSLAGVTSDIEIIESASVHIEKWLKELESAKPES